MSRVLLKLSGEALSTEGGATYDRGLIEDIGRQVKQAVAEKTQVGIVIGGGNYWRGRSSKDMDRTKADQIGMLATVMNCIYVSDVFRCLGMDTVVYTPFVCGTMTEQFSKDRVNQSFREGKVVFLGGGTGHPYFSTDTGIVLRAVELEADRILLAKSIDGVYDKDPKLFSDAKKFDTVSIQEVIDKKLGVVDLTASVLCMENRMPLVVFDLQEKNSIADALLGKIKGTVVTV